MKSPASQDIVQIRRLLAEKFPHLRTTLDTAPKTRACWPTGLPQLDSALNGGLPKGAMSEVVAEADSGAGSALLLQALLRRAQESNQLLTLIDGQDSLDVTALPQEILSRLLWIRCHNAEEALKATDIILRDRNLPLLVLDLKMNPAAQLRKISGTTWYRLQRIVQQTTTVFLVVTPFAMVSGCETRIVLRHESFELTALQQNRSELLARLKFEVARRAFEQSTETPIAQAG